MTTNYARAYTEVLKILKFLPNDEYEKIPKKKIDFYEKHKDNNYIYTFDVSKSLDTQNISREANAIIVSLFRDFYATEMQKQKLNNILVNNENKYQNELREKYNQDNLFLNNNLKKDEIIENENMNHSMQMIEYKQEKFITKIIKKIKAFFQKKEI